MKLIKKKKSKEDEKRENVSKSVVKIIVKRLIGDRIPTIVAEFEASQKREDDFNLSLVSAENNFKEDVTIAREHIIDFLLYKLDFKKGSVEDKIRVVQDKIEEQEKKIKSIEGGYIIAEVKNSEGKSEKKKVKVNQIDEDILLKQYKVLKDVLKNQGEGSYEEINKQGYRQISFLYKDGILIPYYHNATKTTLYPDVGSKRKIYKSEQDLINQEYRDENGNIFSGLFKNVFLVLFIILFVANMYWTAKNLAHANEFSAQLDSSAWQELLDKAEGSAVNCAYYLSTYAENSEYFINYAKEQLNKTDESTPPDSGTVNLQ